MIINSEKTPYWMLNPLYTIKINGKETFTVAWDYKTDLNFEGTVLRGAFYVRNQRPKVQTGDLLHIERVNDYPQDPIDCTDFYVKEVSVVERPDESGNFWYGVRIHAIKSGY